MAATYRVIDPENLSFENIKSELRAYVQARPDAEVWKDWLESSVGTTVIELLAGLGAFLSFHSFGARRESYLDVAKLYSSAVHLSNILGYPVNRVSAPRLKLQINHASSLFWDRDDPIATWNNRDLSLINSQTIPTGISMIEVVVGTWNNFSWTSTADRDFLILQVVDSGIDNNRFSDTLNLWIDSVPTTLTKYAEEMINMYVLERTDIGSLLLLFGDGTLGPRILSGQEVLLDYVTTDGALGVHTIANSEVDPIFDGTITDVVVMEPGSGADSLAKIQLTASGYYQTKRRMCTDEDHVYIFLNYSGDLVSASAQQKEGFGVCCTVLLSYLFEDEHLVVPASPEEIAILAFLEEKKIIGEKIELTAPELIEVDLKITLVIEEGYDALVIENLVRSILNELTWSLGTTFHVGEFTTRVGAIKGVIRVYLEKPLDDKELAFNQYLKLALNHTITVSADRNLVVDVIETPDTGYLETSSILQVAPTGTIANLTPTFDWDVVLGMSKYDLWVQDVTDSVEAYRNSEIVIDSHSIPIPLTSGHYYRWWVRAFVSGEWGIWSQGMDFDIS